MSTRILVCDDEAHITRAIQMKCRKAGFDVETTADGEAGWEAIQRERPSLLVTDYQMPRLDGLALIRRIRADAELQDLPVVLLTAKGFELDEDELKEELDISRLVRKPFSPRELVSTFRELLAVELTG